MSQYETRRRYMIESQLRANKVKDERLLLAFERTAREQFVPKGFTELAYIDEDLELGEGRFLLEPMVFGRLVQALDLSSGDNVLDIGAASGYSTAIIAQLAESVVGIEESKSLAVLGQENLSKGEVDNAVILPAPLNEGFKAEAPYNAIIIEGSVGMVPENLLEQLSEDGRLVTILRPDKNAPGRAVKYTRAGSDFAYTVLFDANTPRLETFDAALKFSFGEQ